MITRGLRAHTPPLTLRLLRHPLFRTTDRAKAERSRFTYRPEGDGYVLSLLGILNGLTGFSVRVK